MRLFVFLKVQPKLSFDGRLSQWVWFNRNFPKQGIYHVLKVQYLLKVDNLGVKADGRMSRVSLLMSEILQMNVLEAASGVTEGSSEVSHFTLIAAGLLLLRLPRFSQLAAISYPFLFSSLCAPVIFCLSLPSAPP